MTERDQTDESLRVERDTADHAIAEEQAAIDDLADAILSRARARADTVLAAARERADRATVPSAPFPTLVRRERLLADQILEGERTQADDVLSAERRQHVPMFSRHREETDNDLAVERVLSDDMQVTLEGLLDVLGNDLRPGLKAMIDLAATVAQGMAQQQDHLRMSMYRLQRTGAAMNRTIDDAIDIARLDSGTFSVIREEGDPAEVVREAVDAFQMQASLRGVSLSAEIGPSARATFDAARILQVLTQLLTEAIKRTPASGSVRVLVEPTAELISITVSDNGADVPWELARTFDPFSAIHAHSTRGTVLTLYVCKRIVQQHGGRVWAVKNVDGGTTFGFTLPR